MNDFFSVALPPLEYVDETEKARANKVVASREEYRGVPNVAGTGYLGLYPYASIGCSDPALPVVVALDSNSAGIWPKKISRNRPSHSRPVRSTVPSAFFIRL